MNPWTLWACAPPLLAIAGLALLRHPLRFTEPTPRESRRYFSRLDTLLGEAGWGGVRAPAAIGMWVITAVLAAALVGVLVPIPVLPFLAFAAILLAGRNLVNGRIAARRRRLRAAWPGIVDGMRQVIRSGGSIPEAVMESRTRVPEELVPALERFGSAVESGMRVDQGLAQLKDDIADPVADRVIEALRMAYEVGGVELPAVLHALQTSVRSDIAAREDALAKQAWIRAASRLGVAAPWLVLILLSGRPETISAYTTTTGGLIIVAGAVVSVVAFRMMSRLGRLPIEQRWFGGRAEVTS